MTNGSKNPEISPDFATTAVDRAYFHIVNDIVALQFYRETSFPTYDQYGLHNFDNKQREILHETRMSLTIARKLLKELDKGLTAYELEVMPEATIKMLGDAMNKVTQTYEESIALKTRNIYARIHAMMSSTKPEGQDKIVTLLEKLFEENGHRFEEILAAHSIRLEGR
jgi:hypothetical protein